MIKEETCISNNKYQNLNHLLRKSLVVMIYLYNISAIGILNTLISSMLLQFKLICFWNFLNVLDQFQFIFLNTKYSMRSDWALFSLHF